MADRTLIKDILKKIMHGALFGLGFGVVIWGIYYYVNEAMMTSMQEQWDTKGKVFVKNDEEVMRGESTLILGALVNEADEAVGGVSVQVDLFDKSGKFVEQCTEYIKGRIHPGEEINFKVTCGCNSNPVVEHTSYKIRVTGI